MSEIIKGRTFYVTNREDGHDRLGEQWYAHCLVGGERIWALIPTPPAGMQVDQDIEFSWLNHANYNSCTNVKVVDHIFSLINSAGQQLISGGPMATKRDKDYQPCLEVNPTNTALVTGARLERAPVVETIRSAIGKKQVYLLNQDDFDKILETGNMVVRETHRTEFDGVQEVILFKKGEAPPPEPEEQYKVEFQPGAGSWQGATSHKAIFKRLIQQIISPVLNKVVYLAVPHNKYQPPQDNGKFNIWLWSCGSQYERGTVQTPSKMWGITVDNRDGSFDSWIEGNPIVTPEGNEVASWDMNNLYIYHDICQCGTANESAIFEKILREFLEARKLEMEGGGTDMSKIKDTYIKFCAKRIEASKIACEKKLKESQTKYDTSKKSMIHEKQTLEIMQRKLDAMHKFCDDDKKRYGDEFEALLKVPKVTRVAMRGEKAVEVFTDVLFFTHPKTKEEHELGKFRIVIDCENNDLKLLNLTRRVDAYQEKMHAPHVFPGGKICQGNLAEILPDLMATYEYAAIALVAIQFLEQVNYEDGAGQHCGKWPVSKRSKEEQKSAKPVVIRKKKALAAHRPGEKDEDEEEAG